MEDEKKKKALQYITDVLSDSTDIVEAVKKIKKYMEEEFGTNELD